MPDRVPGKKSRLFSRPSALLVDDRPLRIELPSPPPIHLSMPLAMGRTQPDEVDEPPPDAPDEPVEGPARLFIGAPRAVAPTGVRAFGGTATGVDEAAPEPLQAPDDWEERLRWTGLDRSARTRVEDVDGRRDRERQERARSRTQPAAWEALAQAPAPRGVVPTPVPEEYATEPAIPAPRLPRVAVSEPPAEPPPPVQRISGAATRAAAADARVGRSDVRVEPPPSAPAPRFPASAANPSRAEDDFFTAPASPRGGGRPPSRPEPTRQVDPPTTPPSARFVPRNQRPSAARVGSSPVVWFVAGLVLIGGALAVVWWRIRGDVEAQPGSPQAVVAVVDPVPSPVPDPGSVPPAEAVVEAPVVVDPPPVEPPEPPVEPPAPPVVTVPVPAPVEPPPVKPPPVVAPVVLAPPLPTPKAPKTNPVPKETGLLVVSSREAVRVRVDGKKWSDAATRHTIELPIGEHKIVLSAGGRPQPFSVRIDESRPTQIEFKSK